LYDHIRGSSQYALGAVVVGNNAHHLAVQFHVVNLSQRREPSPKLNGSYVLSTEFEDMHEGNACIRVVCVVSVTERRYQKPKLERRDDTHNSRIATTFPTGSTVTALTKCDIRATSNWCLLRSSSPVRSDGSRCKHTLACICVPVSQLDTSYMYPFDSPTKRSPDFHWSLPAHGVSWVVCGIVKNLQSENNMEDQAKLYCCIRSRTVRIASGPRVAKEGLVRRLYFPHSSLMYSGEA
jgi:hypothetical protein